nr:U3 snoRNP-associated protein-like EMB2271 [Tanacetum cinerariifolium]
KTKLSYDDGDNDSIKSSESEDEVYNEGGDDVAVGDGDDDVAEKTAGEKRKRVAEAYLEKMREMARREIVEEDDGVASDGDVDERVGKMLHKQHIEDSGRATRLIAKR